MCLQYKSFENTEGKGAISPFPTVFSTLSENLSPFPSKLSPANSLVWKSLTSVVWERVNSLPNNEVIDWTEIKAFADDKLIN